MEEGATNKELVDDLMLFMAYCCAVRGNKEGTIMEKLQAVNFYHGQWVDLSLPLDHFRIKAVRQGIKRAYVEVGNQPRLRRPLTWEPVKELERCAVDSGVGGRVMWMGLALSFILLLQASELLCGGCGEIPRDISLEEGGYCIFPREPPRGGKQSGRGR